MNFCYRFLAFFQLSLDSELGFLLELDLELKFFHIINKLISRLDRIANSFIFVLYLFINLLSFGNIINGFFNTAL